MNGLTFISKIYIQCNGVSVNCHMCGRVDFFYSFCSKYVTPSSNQEVAHLLYITNAIFLLRNTSFTFITHMGQRNFKNPSGFIQWWLETLTNDLLFDYSQEKMILCIRLSIPVQTETNIVLNKYLHYLVRASNDSVAAI